MREVGPWLNAAACLAYCFACRLFSSTILFRSTVRHLRYDLSQSSEVKLTLLRKVTLCSTHAGNSTFSRCTTADHASSWAQRKVTFRSCDERRHHYAKLPSHSEHTALSLDGVSRYAYLLIYEVVGVRRRSRLERWVTTLWRESRCVACAWMLYARVSVGAILTVRCYSIFE